MGSTAAMNSIERVVEKHGKELLAELRENNPSKLIRKFYLTNNLYSLQATAVLTDGTSIELEGWDIDTLAERFPDCEVGY